MPHGPAGAVMVAGSRAELEVQYKWLHSARASPIPTEGELSLFEGFSLPRREPVRGGRLASQDISEIGN